MPPIHGYLSTKRDSQEDDRTLIRQTGIGDPKAFSFLYDRHKTIVFSLAIKISGSHEKTEDIGCHPIPQIGHVFDRPAFRPYGKCDLAGLRVRFWLMP